ncbi:MAG: IS110 family transposase [Anaerolineae bacterium]
MEWTIVGIDWGSRVHSACVMDGEGSVVGEWEFEHSGEAIAGCVDKLIELAGDASCLRVAIEIPHGAVVEALLDRGVKVFSINPKQLDRFRDRHSVAGAKDDDLDAYVLADSLRTDTKLYRPVELPDAGLVELRDISRLYDSLTEQVVALANQVQAQLQRYYVQLRDLGRWHEEPWLWDLFDAAPTPKKLETLRQSDLKAILKSHRIRRYKPLPLLEALQGQKALVVAPGVAEGASARIAMVLPVLRAAHQQRRACEKRIESLLKRPSPEGEEETHRDAEILLSLPGLGNRTGATMLAEAPIALQRRDYQDLRRLCGAAPVSTRTGGKRKKPSVAMRRACNMRLRNALHHWANRATQVDERARRHYVQLRSKGHSHGRALRGVGDRLLKVLVVMLHTGSLFDPELRNPKAEAA